MKCSGVFFEHGFQGFYPLLGLYAIILQSFSANSASFFTLSLWPLNAIFWITQFRSIYNGSNGLPGFLNTSMISPIFTLCVKWNTFFISISLPLSHSLIYEWFVPPSFENFPLFFLTKNPKILLSLPVKEKTQWNRLYTKKQKLKYKMYL